MKLKLNKLKDASPIENFSSPERIDFDFKPIKLTNETKINEVSTLFYNLYKAGKIESTKENLITIITNIFVDKNGNYLKRPTITTHFNDSKELSRSKKLSGK